MTIMMIVMMTYNDYYYDYYDDYVTIMMTIMMTTTSEVNERYKMRIFKKIDKTMREYVLGGQGFPAMCHVPSLDNVALIDFCVAK